MVNKNKQYEIRTSCGVYGRDAVQTHFIEIGEDLFELLERYVVPHCLPGDMVAISSKIVSLYQKRVVYKKDMKLTGLAKFLSRFAASSEAGVGVNSVWKMQYAIDFYGKFRVLWAAVCAGFGKIFGKRGIFYDMLGFEIRGLDGFYDKSFKVYGDFGIQIPRECSALCDEIYGKMGLVAFITDANDITRDILGKAEIIGYSDAELCEMIADNPAGQSDQCTPFLIISRLDTDNADFGK